MRGIEFTSRLPRHKRHALERILFFNGCQDRFARGIVDVIDKYGPPEIVDDGEGLRVRVTDARTPGMAGDDFTISGEVLESTAALRRVVAYRSGR